MTAPHTGEAPAVPVFERVPAASGSLLRAWLAVGLPRWKEERQERATAAWAGAATAGWIVASLVIAEAIDVLAGLLNVAYGGTYGQLTTQPSRDHGLLIALIGPLYHLAQVFIIAFAVALATSLAGYGPVNHRFKRILRPWALVQVPISIAGLVDVLIAPPLAQQNGPELVQFITGTLLRIPIAYVVYVAPVALAVGAFRFSAKGVLTAIAFVSWLGVFFASWWAADWLERLLKLRA